MIPPDILLSLIFLNNTYVSTSEEQVLDDKAGAVERGKTGLKQKLMAEVKKMSTLVMYGKKESITTYSVTSTLLGIKCIFVYFHFMSSLPLSMFVSIMCMLALTHQT